MSVCVNPPKTPVTEGSNGIAAATIPNVCKMPGPPAPFVPTPLPNIGKSGMSPKGYSKKVTIEGNKVAIKGATFGSMGDVASKGTGGGIVSMNCEGPTAFLGPGSMNVKIEGKNVQLLGDPMLNNCGPSGSPANAATMMGVLQARSSTAQPCVHDYAGPPRCPPSSGEDDLNGRIKEMQGSRDEDRKFEGDAAKHNEYGIRRAEKALGGSAVSDRESEEKKVKYRCTKCGRVPDGEIDHLSMEKDGTLIAVECKTGEGFNPAKSTDETERNIRQMKRYRSFGNQPGRGVTYKIPKDHALVKIEILKTAKALGFNVSVIFV